MTTLKIFCQDSLEALDNNFKPVWGFRQDYALCANSYLFDRYYDYNAMPPSIRRELKEIFRKVYGHEIFPFNASSFEFTEEEDNLTFYKNEKRLAFLREYAYSE